MSNGEEDLSSIFGSNTSAIDIMKDMLRQDNIFIKSQVNLKQMRSMCKIAWLAELRKPENKEKNKMVLFQEKIFPLYLALKCSLNRQSRTEILDALKTMNPKFIESEGNLLNMFNGSNDKNG